MYDEELEQDQPKQIGDHLFAWKRKFDNFVYHYKIALIFIVLISAFIIFAIVQCSGKIQGDANIAYIGSLHIDAEHHANLQRALNEILGEDLNGDGEIHVDFTHFFYMTQPQRENARAQGRIVDEQAMMAVQTRMHSDLAAGNIIIYFMDTEIYRELNSPGVFMPLEDIFGHIPEIAHDAYTIRMGNLQAWRYWEGLEAFPANTVIAVRNMHLAEEGRPRVQERYERNLEMLRRLIDFKYLPEEDIDADAYTDTEE
jgi:hypothetical protein